MLTQPQFARKGRTLLPGQVSELTVIDADGGNRQVIFTADEIIEAPNWTPDGAWLVFNAGGEIWRISPDGKDGPHRIDTGSIRDLNNDHVLSPDGSTIYLSNGDWHLYSVPITGGEPKRVSNDHPGSFIYFLHGISPDGKTLAYVGVEPVGDNRWGKINLFTIPAAGGPDTRLTDLTHPHDGPEYSPDGQWIYFNSERASPGQAQIFRMKPDGSGVEQLTFDERVNWFPHFWPDGKRFVYISFPPATQGHPADKAVILRTANPDGTDVRDVIAFNGGQGTINVNSCAPDNKRFAYVAYPVS